MRSKEMSFHAGAPASSAPTATDRNSELGVRQGAVPATPSGSRCPHQLDRQIRPLSRVTTVVCGEPNRALSLDQTPLSRTSQLLRGGRPRTSRPAPT